MSMAFSLRTLRLCVRSAGWKQRVSRKAAKNASLKTVLLSRRSFAGPPDGGRFLAKFFDNSDSFILFFSYPASPTAHRVGAAGGILLFLSVRGSDYRVKPVAHSFISSCICEDTDYLVSYCP